MTIKVKRIHLALSKTDLYELDKLSKHFEENYSSVMRRAIILLHYITFDKDKI